MARAKQWNPMAGVNMLGMFSNPKAPGINADVPGGVPAPALFNPPTVNWNWNQGGVGRGITAGGGGASGRSVPGSGYSPLTGNDQRLTGRQMLQDQYRAYSRGLVDDGTAEDQIPTYDQWYQARLAAFNAMGGSANINQYNVGDYYRNFNRELERIMNPREPRTRPGEEEVGLQQMPMWGYGQIVNQRY